MKRGLVLVLLLAVLSLGGAAFPSPSSAQVFEPSTVRAAVDNSLTVVVCFEVPTSQVQSVTSRAQAAGLNVIPTLPSWPMAVPLNQTQEVRVVAVIGAGTLLRNNCVLSVSHLIDQSTDDGIPMRVVKAWVLLRTVDHPVTFAVVAQSPRREFYDDYAVFKLDEDLGMRGASVSRERLVPGEPVMFCGSVSGAAFFARFGFVTEFHRFLRKDDNGVLHLSQWTEFPLVCVYPGGGGDSGGGIFNAEGDLAGVMYCGIEVASEGYIFSNPLASIREFLATNKLKKLLR